MGWGSKICQANNQWLFGGQWLIFETLRWLCMGCQRWGRGQWPMADVGIAVARGPSFTSQPLPAAPSCSQQLPAAHSITETMEAADSFCQKNRINPRQMAEAEWLVICCETQQGGTGKPSSARPNYVVVARAFFAGYVILYFGCTIMLTSAPLYPT